MKDRKWNLPKHYAVISAEEMQTIDGGIGPTTLEDVNIQITKLLVLSQLCWRTGSTVFFSLAIQTVRQSTRHLPALAFFKRLLML